MSGLQPVPGQIVRQLNDFVGAKMAPSSSKVPAIYRDTTRCYPYMCSYTYGCTERTNRTAQVLKRRCMRYLPQEMRITPALSEFSLDLLAKRRQAGEPLSPVTTAVLDQFRPNGPLRKQV
jgi:hypothetical protein